MTKQKTSRSAGASKSAHRSAGRRVTVEQNQEYQSRGQFDVRMTEMGWVVNPKTRDHGEDFLVDIYDEGLSSGLAFLAQLKSTTASSTLVPAKDQAVISYRLFVADLKHWEVAAQLIVIFVWDVSRKTGFWTTIPEILKGLELDESWRSQKTVTVHLSRRNDTSDAGLGRLRRLVADRNLPIVRQGKKLEIKSRFSFPPTEEGRAAAEEFRRAIDYGEPVEIDGKFIENWDMSDWWNRLFGQDEPQSVAISCTRGTVDIPVRVEIDQLGEIYSREINLRRVKVGQKGFTLSNEHEKSWLRLTVVGKEDGDVMGFTTKLKWNHLVPDIFQARDAAEFALAVRQRGRFRVVLREGGLRFCDGEVPADSPGWSVSLLRDWIAFLNKLHVVQAKIHRHGVVRIPKKGVSRQAAQAVEFFHAVCTKDAVLGAGEASMTLQLVPESWNQMVKGAEAGEPLEVQVRQAEGGTIKILNVKVPLGPLIIYFNLNAFLDQIKAALAAGQETATIAGEGPSRRIYLNWSPPPTPSPSEPLLRA